MFAGIKLHCQYQRGIHAHFNARGVNICACPLVFKLRPQLSATSTQTTSSAQAHPFMYRSMYVSNHKLQSYSVHILMYSSVMYGHVVMAVQTLKMCFYFKFCKETLGIMLHFILRSYENSQICNCLYEKQVYLLLIIQIVVLNFDTTRI